MQIKRAAAVPLITHDPYFSIWCNTDTLNEAYPIHWSGARQAMRGWLEIDGVPLCFLGRPGEFGSLKQTKLSVSATSTVFEFEHEKLRLTVTFTSPLLLDDPALLARPCTYIRLAVQLKKPADVRAHLQLSADLVRCTPGRVIGGVYHADGFRYACMGKAQQHPLGNSGDRITIDWGYAYLACPQPQAELAFDAEEEQLCVRAPLADGQPLTLVAAYDDTLSLCCFGQWLKGYWTTRWPTIQEAIRAAFDDRAAVCERCAALDQKLEDAARKAGGEDYAFLCALSYRHTIAAHKLAADEHGEPVFLSKENDSNGCIGTVDVTYPSVPLFLLQGTEYVKAMLRPIFRFAACPVWEFDFAPHDLGRYPYANGQIYGCRLENTEACDASNGSILPPFYAYPRGGGLYEKQNQMPVEESGNLLILTAAVCRMEHSADFALPHLSQLESWTGYLLKYGADPGEQLCTDDFAGHLAHNTNLALKAILGVEAFGQILGLLGQHDRAAQYHRRAADMAAGWQSRARGTQGYSLAFDRQDTFSLKYNLIWDRLLDSRLFSDEVARTEIACYLQKSGPYGTPLDTRASYTKSDWLLWCAALAPVGPDRDGMIAPVARYLRESESRVPFSDWYDTQTGRFLHFMGRSVQGGIYMPLLADRGLGQTLI